MKSTGRINRFMLTLGPGLLFASTAIGVSHLVQSTRAGADYGFGLLWAVIIANVFKYPFFEFGSRYANCTGEHIISGYRKIGSWMLWAYIGITFLTMFFVSSAVGSVTAGFLDNLLGLHLIFSDSSHVITTAFLFSSCLVILSLGKFKALDRIIKIIGTLLLISTVTAFMLAILNEPSSNALSAKQVLPYGEAGFAFLIALMGWMPTAVDLSAWNSLWTLERIKSSNYKPSLKETLFEFKLGYWISAILAIMFVAMGALILKDSDNILPSRPDAFANAVVTMYTSAIGSWSYPIIAVSAFSIMFGTCIAVFDGYARSLSASLEVARKSFSEFASGKRFYVIVLLITTIVAFVLSSAFNASMKLLVDIATTLSFVVAPLIAWANHHLIFKHTDKAARPGKFMYFLSVSGIVFLTGFSFVYLFSDYIF